MGKGTGLYKMDDIIGHSDAMLRLKSAALRAAKFCPSTLLLGESGTGKELFAQAIHSASPRADGPFVAVNCGAIPQSLLESELFGYEAGAFTGAQKNGKAGKFELANDGTLFLDEIGDMPYEAQVSLLRVLQTREVVRVGGRQQIKLDLMIIAATHQNLEEKIAGHTFREDLYYRLNVLNFEIPSLRDRGGDVEELAHFFVHKYNREFDRQVQGISSDALQRLEQYSWPGNVRELENAIARAVIVCEGSHIQTEDLPDRISDMMNQVSVCTAECRTEKAVPLSFSQKGLIDADCLKRELVSVNGNLTKAAKQLGISHPTLYRKLKKYGLYEELRVVNL